MKLFLCFVVTLFLNVTSEDDSGWSFVGNPLLAFRPCKGSTDISGSYEPGRSPDKENIYNIFVHKSLPKHSVVTLKFDTDTSVILVSDQSLYIIFLHSYFNCMECPNTKFPPSNLLHA